MIEATYTLTLRAVAAALPMLSRGEGKLARGIRGRGETLQRLQAWARQHRDARRPLVLFHAPSVGEGLQLGSVIEAFAANRPDVQLAYTFFSPSAEKLASRMPVDVADYLPLDTPAHMRGLLDALRPSAIVFSKTEVWPNLIRLATERGIPSGLVNATLPASSSRLRAPARLLLRSAHARLARVGAISSSDAVRYQQLGVHAERASVMGDAHFDRVRRKASLSTPPAELQRLFRNGDRPVLVGGSTWPADEVRLLATISAIDLPLRVLLVPHEPTEPHLARLEKVARGHGLVPARLSQLRGGDLPTLLLVDRVGILGDLYGLADITYVGGGFGSAGLHSVLEPAAFGRPILFGPHHSNSREAAELIQAGGALVVRDGTELRDQLLSLTSNRGLRQSMGAAAGIYVETGLGASGRGAAIVEELLTGAA